jgi:hypothetical protein
MATSVIVGLMEIAKALEEKCPNEARRIWELARALEAEAIAQCKVSSPSQQDQRP